MRITLLIDIETTDIPSLQEVMESQPPAYVQIDGWTTWGRLMGAKQAFDPVHESQLKGEQ